MVGSTTGSAPPAAPSAFPIRNVALIGHGGVGKTTVAEALLARAGAIDRRGSVDAGTSLLDGSPESVARRMSVALALAPFTWTASDGVTYQVNLIDTPGYDEFVGQVASALSVADLAVVVVSAVDGVQVHTERLWSLAGRIGVPRLVFVNKDDAERADFAATLADLRDRLDGVFVPLEVPLGENASLHGIADLMTEQAYEYDHGSSARTEIPRDAAGPVHDLHDALVDDIVSGDDRQLERFLSGEEPSAPELERTLAREVLDSTRVPVLVGSAATDVGLDRLADLICELGPAPRPVEAEGAPGRIVVSPDPGGAPLVRVFATVADPYVGQMSLVRVLSGTLTSDQHLVNARTGTDERVHGMVRLRGTLQTPVAVAHAGDLVAIPKLRDTRTDDVLGQPGGPVVTVAAPPRAEPVHSVAVEPRTQGDDDRLSQALQRLAAEDPALRVERHRESHQTVLSGAGEVHLAVAVERLARTFGVRVDTLDVAVPHRETVLGSARAQGKVKKQSGGHGQFAVVELEVSPLPRGSGIEFVDAVVGGAIPRHFVAAVERGVMDCADQGGVHGHPVVDVRVACVDGKAHAVDSSDMAFRTAAAQALRAAMSDAGVAVLEPVSRVVVTVPSEFQGAVLGDITRRRGRVHASDTNGDGRQVITASVPTSELRRYAVDLRSLTAGRAEVTVAHDHYDVMPTDLVATLPNGGRSG